VVVVGVTGNRAVGDAALEVELKCLITAVGTAPSAAEKGCCITEALRAVLELVGMG
jgi:hypothetical protein